MNLKKPTQAGEFIDGKTLNQIIGHYKKIGDTNLEELYNNIGNRINKLSTLIKEVSAEDNVYNFYKEIFDSEILRYCVIKAIGLLNQTESMLKWDPYPFNDNGRQFAEYKKKRFETPLWYGREVPDEFIINLLKGDIAPKPQIRAVEKEEDGAVEVRKFQQ